ncbi:hypothetical protein [Planococcus sp. 107-1]|nr:hypothetical protein [Planococcus sp. 107-1]UJF25496.1 hypothetical protein L0M13_09435 [Planococcus sp. 107-1]
MADRLSENIHYTNTVGRFAPPANGLSAHSLPVLSFLGC